VARPRELSGEGGTDAGEVLTEMGEMGEMGEMRV
jgi:hypothetical protein